MSHAHEDQEFRDNVIRMLTSVDTKMSSLIGDATTIGRVPRLEAKVEDLEAHKNRALGWAAGAVAVGTAILAVAEWLLHTGSSVK